MILQKRIEHQQGFRFRQPPAERCKNGDIMLINKQWQKGAPQKTDLGKADQASSAPIGWWSGALLRHSVHRSVKQYHAYDQRLLLCQSSPSRIRHTKISAGSWCSSWCITQCKQLASVSGQLSINLSEPAMLHITTGLPCRSPKLNPRTGLPSYLACKPASNQLCINGPPMSQLITTGQALCTGMGCGTKPWMLKQR